MTIMNEKMKKRITFGLIMIAVMVGLFVLDQCLTRDVYSTSAHAWVAAAGSAVTVKAIPLAALFGVLILVAFREIKSFAAAAGVKILPVSGVIATAGVGTLPFWWQFIRPAGPTGDELFVALGAAVMLVFAEHMIRKTTEDAVRRVACTLLAVAYLGICGAIIVNIRIRYNLPALVLFLAAVKCTDIGAYFTGSFIGRHKLIPWLSPGKTWEGLLGGLVTAAIVSVLLTLAMDVRVTDVRLPLWFAAVFGAAVGLVGQFGDLSESLLKRAVGFKDSGQFLPEFGGILDLLDSPLLSAPVAMALLMLCS